MKALKILGIIVLVLVVLVVGALWYATRYVNTPAFKGKLLAAAREAAGADVKIGAMNVSLWSGITLKDMAVANPTGFAGQLLTVDAFVLRYRLLPLLRGRVEIQQLSLDRPVITLSRNAKSEWNYENLGAPADTPPVVATPSAPATKTGMPLDIALSKLALTHGDVLMLGEAGKPLAKVQGIDFTSAVKLTGSKLSGAGRAGVDLIAVAESLFVRQVSAPVSFTGDDVRLAPLGGKMADGNVSGELALRLMGGFKYLVNLQVKDSDVSKLLQEAGAKQVMTGKLQLAAKFEGTGGLPTMAGAGKAEITGGKLMEIPALNLVATLLQVPELRDMKFDECLMEFSLTNNGMQTPVIRLTSPRVQITGKGSVSLTDYSLNHNLTLVFAKGVLDNAPKEVRGIFAERPDGSRTLEFRVWGPYDAPKTDIADRLVTGTTQQLLEKGLQKLLK
jgi:hypothetical protein